MTQTATDTITIPIIAEDRANALLHALDMLAADGVPSSPAAKHAARLRFALNRLADLRLAADRDRGAFTASRAEVALSILNANIVIATQFVARARGMEISGRNAQNRSQTAQIGASNSDQRQARSATERDQMISAETRPSLGAIAKRPPSGAAAAADNGELLMDDAQVARTAA